MAAGPIAERNQGIYAAFSQMLQILISYRTQWGYVVIFPMIIC